MIAAELKHGGAIAGADLKFGGHRLVIDRKGEADHEEESGLTRAGNIWVRFEISSELTPECVSQRSRHCNWILSGSEG